ncbi:hypothetical protein J3R82DRAFT_10936 [Butyriboletus roseoflavus]|nr:hypothetical protein J3R82DRAFT_10936 [Butyriboletus roseoflavus]
MSPLPIVLIFTYSEYGQANVTLATSYELALAGVNVYIASFSPLRTRVSRLQELVDRHASCSRSNSTGSVNFREFKGIASWNEALMKHGMRTADLAHSHGVSGALESYSKINLILYPWSQEEFVAAVESCKEIITAIKPNVVVIDNMFHIAQDACKLADQKFINISPNSTKDIVVMMQPYLAGFWKYPVFVVAIFIHSFGVTDNHLPSLSSGFPFPLKWWQIPLNIYLHVRLAIRTMTSTQIKQFLALRRSLGVNTTPKELGNQLGCGVTHICPALVETDFAFTLIPKHLHLCGPIIIPFDPLEETDPALMKWLDDGPTVMVNLGSHVVSDERVAREMASAFRILLDYHNQRGASKIQVLWKVMESGDIQGAIDDIIGKEIKEGRVKVLPWMEAEPVSILQHPNVVCTVHHGGANSFFEGVWSGIPHIVLPVWLDTYDHANRAEFLSIGIFGNKTCAPSVRAEEFGKALVRVTGDTEEAGKFRRSAKRLKELCRARGNGRELSSMVILKEAGISKLDAVPEI